MNLTDWLTSNIINRIERIGESVLFIVSLLLALDYFSIISLRTLWNPIIWILWGYLILNIGLANIFKFWRNKDNPICPKCKRKLNEIKEYECSKCGKLKFDGKKLKNS